MKVRFNLAGFLLWAAVLAGILWAAATMGFEGDSEDGIAAVLATVGILVSLMTAVTSVEISGNYLIISRLVLRKKIIDLSKVRYCTTGTNRETITIFFNDGRSQSSIMLPSFGRRKRQQLVNAITDAIGSGTAVPSAATPPPVVASGAPVPPPAPTAGEADFLYTERRSPVVLAWTIVVVALSLVTLLMMVVAIVAYRPEAMDGSYTEMAVWVVLNIGAIIALVAVNRRVPKRTLVFKGGQLTFFARERVIYSVQVAQISELQIPEVKNSFRFRVVGSKKWTTTRMMGFAGRDREEILTRVTALYRVRR